jgi:hypothetical protein
MAAAKGEITEEVLKVSALLLSRYDPNDQYRKARQKPLSELAKEYGVELTRPCVVSSSVFRGTSSFVNPSQYAPEVI